MESVLAERPVVAVSLRLLQLLDDLIDESAGDRAKSAWQVEAKEVLARLRGETTVRPEKDERYASRAEYENHMPWCRARQFNSLNVAKCTCDLKSATVRVEE